MTIPPPKWHTFFALLDDPWLQGETGKYWLEKMKILRWKPGGNSRHVTIKSKSLAKSLLCPEEEKDDRYESVILMEYSDEAGAETKTTAQDCKDYWIIRDWEITGNLWYCAAGYSISKKYIDKLAAKQKHR